jgi:hypothetical protein
MSDSKENFWVGRSKAQFTYTVKEKELVLTPKDDGGVSTTFTRAF